MASRAFATNSQFVPLPDEPSSPHLAPMRSSTVPQPGKEKFPPIGPSPLLKGVLTASQSFDPIDFSPDPRTFFFWVWFVLEKTEKGDFFAPLPSLSQPPPPPPDLTIVIDFNFQPFSRLYELISSSSFSNSSRGSSSLRASSPCTGGLLIKIWGRLLNRKPRASHRLSSVFHDQRRHLRVSFRAHRITTNSI